MGVQRLPDHEQRLRQARARAEWELGEASWATMIVDAYCDPERDAAELAEDMAEIPGQPV